MTSDPPENKPDTPGCWITGVGLLTPLGTTAWDTFGRLLAGDTLLSRAERWPQDVPAVQLRQLLGAVGGFRQPGSDPAVRLAERALREAAGEAGVTTRGLPVFLGTSKGAIHAWQAAAQRHLGIDQDAEKTGGFTRLVSDPSQAMLRQIDLPEHAVALGPHGYVATMLADRTGCRIAGQSVAACASGLVALDQARRWLAHQPVGTRAAVVSVDAALLPLLIGSYQRLGVLAEVGRAGTPLDASRHGFHLAEQAAAVVLERRPTPPQPRCVELLDTQTAGEAFDIIRTAPGMPAARHVADALLARGPVDLLHPHTPGTPAHDDGTDHDATELRIWHEAITHAGHALPDVYACKGAIGHGLGAAGLAALVVACQCARLSRRPPMPWLTDPIAEWVHASAPDELGPINRQAVLAAGFGGHTAGALLGPATRQKD